MESLQGVRGHRKILDRNHMASLGKSISSHLQYSQLWPFRISKKTTSEISRCFITGVSPHSMMDFMSGFNFVTNVSHKKTLSGLHSLDDEDVLATLQLSIMCGPDEDEVQEHSYINMK
ncbi:9068_t:CDS:1 [Paraglomus occultum]|uniref:9068_t:CDS:1 n=1 Tax=Paraglomus occultum TaxID=144539 RepID=A0A9N9D5X2_9GLOM|nr:9068_t:CDS:1 [Paraglomus occultum]